MILLTLNLKIINGNYLKRTKVHTIGRKKPVTKLYLHAGTHKTGTTAIQSFSSLHRADLERRGLIYPGYSPIVKKKQEAHHWLAHALAENESVPLPAETVPLLARRWLKKARRKHSDVFVSAEAIYRHVIGAGTYAENRKRYLVRLAESLDGFEVTVILVYRRPDDYIRSIFQERVNRSAHPIPDFEKYYQSGQPGLQYHLNATLFKEVFPSLICLIYEDLIASEDFFSQFFTDRGKTGQVGEETTQFPFFAGQAGS